MLKREGDQNRVFHTEEHIYNQHILLSMLILLRKLSPLCAIALRVLVLLDEMS